VEVRRTLKRFAQDPSAVLQQGYGACDCRHAVEGFELNRLRPVENAFNRSATGQPCLFHDRLHRVTDRILVDSDGHAGMRDSIALCQVSKWIALQINMRT